MDVTEAIQMIRKGLMLLEEASTPPGKRGRKFEEEFVHLCRERGIRASRVVGRGNVDIIANSLRVQAKCYPFAKSGRVRVKNGHMAPYSSGDFDVLAACILGEVYIIPVAALIAKRSRGSLVSTVFVSEIARFKNAWHVLTGGGVADVVSQREIPFV